MSVPQERLPQAAGGSAAATALVLASIPLGLAAAWRPRELLIGSIVIALLALSVLRVEYVLLLLIALAPLEGAFQISSNPQLSPTKLLGVLCIGGFLLTVIVSRRRLVLDLSHGLALLLLAMALLSTVQARNTTEATSVSLRYASFIALFLVLSQFVRRADFQRQVAWVLTTASALAGLLAIQNFIGGNTYLARLPHADPNDTAYVLATTLPLAFWLLGARASLRAPVLIMIGVISASVLLSFSRGALVGLAAGAIWHVITQRRHIPVLLAGAVVGLVVAGAFARSNPERIETGLELKSNIAAENVESRLTNWEAAAKLAVSHPIGIGPGNFRDYYFEATGRPPSTVESLVVHNTYLEIAAELGLAALAVFLAYLVLTFRRLSTVNKEGLGPDGLAQALITSLVIAIVAGLFLSEQYYAPFWVIGALATALWAERQMGAGRLE